MNRILFAGLLSRAAETDFDQELIDAPASASPVVSVAPVNAPAAVLNVIPDNIAQTIDPFAFNVVDTWGRVVPNPARWEINPRRYIVSSNGGIYTDLLDLLQEQYDYSLSEADALAAVYRQNPRAAQTIDALGLRNYTIVQPDAQHDQEWQASPVAAQAPFATSDTPYTPNQEPIEVPGASAPVYAWTPQTFVPEAPAVAPLAPLAPVVSVSPAAPAPATSTTAPGVTSATLPTSGNSGGVYGGWIDAGGGGVSLDSQGNPAPAPAAGSKAGALILAALGALALLNS